MTQQSSRRSRRATYRAGPFGHDGFPKVGSRPRARQFRLRAGLPEGLRERRRPVATVAAVVVLAAAVTAGPPPAGTLAKPPVVPMATVMPRPTPTAAAVQGVLSVDQNQLHFVSVGGGDSTRMFVITAKDGPVTGYTIVVPPGLPGTLTVSPSSGSLPDGGSATITVTAASTVPFVTRLIVHPGGAVIAVDVKAKP
jgi:hypothetical protein